MTEGQGGKGPEIIIPPKGASIDELRLMARETSYRPQESAPGGEKPKVESPGEKKEERQKSKFEQFLDELGTGGKAILVEEIFETIREGIRSRRQGREGGGGEGRAGGEVAEGVAEERGFYQIQEDLRSLIDKPDPDREKELRLERARLVNEAKEIGLFNVIKDRLYQIQAFNDFEKAENAIEEINIANLEIEARGLNGWKEIYVGMLDEYRDVALLNMDLAMLRAMKQGTSDEAKALLREREIRGWGSPPQGLEGMARKYLEEELIPRPEAVPGRGEPAGGLAAAAEAMSRAAEAQARFARGEYYIDLSEYNTPEKLRVFVRERLSGIENSNRDTHDYANTYLVRGLEVALGDMEKIDRGVAREVRARLAVHDCAELIKQADGWIFREQEKVGPGFAIGSAAAEARKRGHELNRETAETFLRREFLPGYDVPRAWNLLQELNYFYETKNDKGETVTHYDNYQKWVSRAYETGLLKLEGRDEEGRKEELKSILKGVQNYYRDQDPVRKDAVRKLIIQEISEKGGIDIASAEKSLQLAEKLSVATLEDSVFNRGDTVGNDQAAEIFGLRRWREGRAEKGRVRGPQVHEDEIDGFGTSWLRWTQERKQSKQFPKEKQVEKLPLRVDTPMMAEDLDMNEIQQNWQFYCSVIMTRYKLLNELVLDRKPKLHEMEKTFMQTAVVYFNTADSPVDLRTQKLGPMRLRGLWVAGVVDIALADRGIDTGRMSIGQALGQFIKAVTREELSPQTGTFIDWETWDWIRRKLNFDSRLRQLGADKGFKAFMEKALAG